MNWRERLADWISGGAVTQARDEAMRMWEGKAGAGIELARVERERDGLRAEAANISAQRDEAITRAESAERSLLFVHNESAARFRSILTARNITEARKIARQALGEAE